MRQLVSVHGGFAGGKAGPCGGAVRSRDDYSRILGPSAAATAERSLRSRHEWWRRTWVRMQYRESLERTHP